MGYLCFGILHVWNTKQYRNILKPDKANAPWWNQNFNAKINKYEVGFYFIDGFDETRKNTIRTKFTEFARDTCVKMVEVDKSNSAYKNKIEVQQGRGCSSYVGRHFSNQMLSLAPGCERSYIPLHEVK